MYEILIEHFFTNGHKTLHNDLRVQTIDYCDPKDPERRENVWIYCLNAWALKGFNAEDLI